MRTDDNYSHPQGGLGSIRLQVEIIGQWERKARTAGRTLEATTNWSFVLKYNNQILPNLQSIPALR
jgi:hypothetical protein